jgi:hypothetical protein
MTSVANVYLLGSYIEARRLTFGILVVSKDALNMLE